MNPDNNRCLKCGAPERYVETDNMMQVFCCGTEYQFGYLHQQTQQCRSAERLTYTERLLKNRVWQQLGPDGLAELEREANGGQP